MIAQFVTVVYLLAALRLWSFFSFRAWNANVAKRIIAYSLPLVPNSLCWWIINMAGRLIISLVLGAAQNGIFSVASKFSAAFIQAYNVFNLSWSESVSLHSKDEDADSFFSNVVGTAMCVFSLMCSVILLLIPPFFDLLIDSEYSEAYYLIPLLMAGALAQVYVGLLSALYIALKCTKEIAKTSAYAAMMSIAITLSLINLIGSYAAAVAMIVSFGAMSVYRTLDVRSRIRFSPSKSKMISAFSIIWIGLLAYYAKSQIICAISLVAVVIIGISANKEFVRSIAHSICTRLRR